MFLKQKQLSNNIAVTSNVDQTQSRKVFIIILILLSVLITFNVPFSGQIEAIVTKPLC